MVIIKNATKDTQLYVTLGPSGDGQLSIPSNNDKILEPGTTVKLKKKQTYEDGTGMLYIWSESKQLLWKGFVPASGNKTVDILNENGVMQVIYDGIELESCVERECYSKCISSNVKKMPLWLWIVIAVLILLTAYIIYKKFIYHS